VALAKGSTAPGRTINGRLTQAQLLEIAKEKMQDMNAYTPEAAASMLAGTARSMGIEVID